jgi:hypothetical protein
MCTQASEDDEEAETLVMPTTRAGCAEVPRPCPHLRCKYNLQRRETYSKSGVAGVIDEVKGYRFAPTPAHQSCVLDCADDGPMELVDIGRLIGVSGERVSQICSRAIDRVPTDRFQKKMEKVLSLDWRLLYLQDMQYAEIASEGELSRTPSHGGGC